MATYDIKTITDLNGNTLNLVDAGAQRTLVSGTSIKTIDGASVLGSGDIETAPIDASVITLATAMGWTASS